MLRSFISFVVHRRLLALCATALIAIYGVWSYLHTAIEAYPDVTNVQVGVIAQAPGLAPEEVERQITQPLERELNGTPGLVSLRSESYFGLAMINLVFNDDAVSFNARAEVSQRLPQADLPQGTTLSDGTISVELALDNGRTLSIALQQADTAPGYRILRWENTAQWTENTDIGNLWTGGSASQGA